MNALNSKFVGSLIFCLTFFLFGSTPFLPDPNNGPIKTIVIDAGHGGKDPGCLGKSHKEKDIALAIALEVRRLLQENLPGIRVVMTRDDDTFVELHQRAEIARQQKADFFLSIHCNAIANPSIRGGETYILGANPGQESYRTIIAENEAILFEHDHKEMYGGFDPSTPEGFIYFRLLKNAFRAESAHLATRLQEYYESRIERPVRGVKQGPFVVLWRSGMPAVLTEVGYLTNKEDEAYLGSEVGQLQVANCIYRAIKSYNIEAQVAAVERP